MGRLDGRVAIITGSGRGVGASIARLFAREGATVVVNDLGVNMDGGAPRSEPAEQVVADIVAAGGTATLSTHDISDHAQAEELIRQTIETHGKLDVLANVAGILRDRMVFNMPEEDWDAVIKVHLKGTFNTSKFAAAYWRDLRDENAHHRLINFTSRAGLFGAPGQPNYAAAKMGIVGFTYSCANALRRYGVTSNVIGPSAATRMTSSIPAERLAESGADAESPDNVAPAVAYVASTRSDWCNGQIIAARGYNIGLYNQPALIRQLTSTGPWELDQAFDLIEESFKPAILGERLFD